MKEPLNQVHSHILARNITLVDLMEEEDEGLCIILCEKVEVILYSKESCK